MSLVKGLDNAGKNIDTELEDKCHDSANKGEDSDYIDS
jgi:hypothetical protein